MILLPLRPASLTHKNLKRGEIIHGMRPVGCKDRSIHPFVFVEISCSCNSCGSHYGSCLTEHISFSLFCALKQKDYILISVYCSKEFWNLSSD